MEAGAQLLEQVSPMRPLQKIDKYVDMSYLAETRRTLQ